MKGRSHGVWEVDARYHGQRCNEVHSRHLEVLESRDLLSAVPLGDYITVLPVTTGSTWTTPCAVATAADGSFVSVWQTNYPLDGDTAHGLQARLYDSAGLVVGDTFDPIQQRSFLRLATHVAMSDSGKFIVVWHGREDFYSLQDQIWGRFYDEGGTPLGSEFVIQAVPASSSRRRRVAMAGDGSEFVVTWSEGSTGNGTTTSRIKAALYDVVGETVMGSTFDVISATISGTATTFIDPAVAMDASGDFVVAWDNDETNAILTDKGIYAQLYDDTERSGRACRILTTIHSAYFQTTLTGTLSVHQKSRGRQTGTLS